MWYHLLYNKFVHRVKVRWEFLYIDFRLKFKGYSDKKILSVMSRFVDFKKLKRKKEDRESRKMFNDIIVDLSEKTGAPQWDVRAKINHDFKIDL